MPIYGIAIIPLIRTLEDQYKQVWYVDDSAAIVKTDSIFEWWEGYYKGRCCEERCYEGPVPPKVITAFAAAVVKITSEGRSYLGAVIGPK